jgi:hypothetical protein
VLPATCARDLPGADVTNGKGCEICEYSPPLLKGEYFAARSAKAGSEEICSKQCEVGSPTPCSARGPVVGSRVLRPHDSCSRELHVLRVFKLMAIMSRECPAPLQPPVIREFAAPSPVACPLILESKTRLEDADKLFKELLKALFESSSCNCHESPLIIVEPSSSGGPEQELLDDPTGSCELELGEPLLLTLISDGANTRSSFAEVPAELGTATAGPF